jgi:hypothetical protein
MRLTYTTTVEDWLAFTEYALLRDPQSADALAIWRWFVAILSGAIAAYIFSDISGTVSLVAGLVVVAAMDETPSHVFVRLSLRSGFVIPKKAVEAESLQSFLAELGRRMGGQRSAIAEDRDDG